MSDSRITQQEIASMFGGEIPAEALALLFSCPDEWTIGRLRQELRSLASSRASVKAVSGDIKDAFEAELDGMCLTWDHSFGLMLEDQREGLRRRFRQLAGHHIYRLMSDAERRGAEKERANAMRPRQTGAFGNYHPFD